MCSSNKCRSVADEDVRMINLISRLSRAFSHCRWSVTWSQDGVVGVEEDSYKIKRVHVGVSSGVHKHVDEIFLS